MFSAFQITLNLTGQLTHFITIIYAKESIISMGKLTLTSVYQKELSTFVDQSWYLLITQNI